MTNPHTPKFTADIDQLVAEIADTLNRHDHTHIRTVLLTVIRHETQAAAARGEIPDNGTHHIRIHLNDIYAALQ